jgi:hypothetical protein
MVKLPDGRTVAKDGPEYRSFMDGLNQKNAQNGVVTTNPPPKKTVLQTTLNKNVPVLNATTVVRREGQTPTAGKLLDEKSDYRPTSYQAKDFDSTRRVVETPVYDSKSRLYMDNSTH